MHVRIVSRGQRIGQVFCHPIAAPRRGRPDRPEAFSDAAIRVCLSLKGPFGLALRQTVGMVASLSTMTGLDGPVPDHSTVGRSRPVPAADRDRS